MATALAHSPHTNSLPSRAALAAERARENTPRFLASPMAEAGGCACSIDHEDRPTEQPVGFILFLLDEDDDRYRVGVWNTPLQTYLGACRAARDAGHSRFNIAGFTDDQMHDIRELLS